MTLEPKDRSVDAAIKTQTALVRCREIDAFDQFDQLAPGSFFPMTTSQMRAYQRSGFRTLGQWLREQTLNPFGKGVRV